jgi:hypothetical protein
MKSLVALVGTQYRGDEAKALLPALPQGEPLTLIRELDNKYDQAAVQVWARGVHIGYLKAGQNRKCAFRMDLDPSLSPMAAKLAIDGGKWPMVEIEI